jgi:pimeloyl-ACP methyl ester carboxylesterase
MSSKKQFAVLAFLGLFVTSLYAVDAPEDHFFDSNGVQIRYTVQGAGEPIILVHGFTGNGDSNWRGNGVIGRLEEDFKVIALDARGHGKSGKPHDPAAYGLEMVNDVVRLMDHLEIEKTHLVGYSMGGFITLAVASLHPGRLLSAVIGGAGWNEPGAETGLETLADSLEAGKGIGPLLVALTPAGQPPPTEEQLAMINQMILASNDPLALAAVIRGMDGLDTSREEIASIEVPMIAIVGEIDPLREAAERLSELLPAVEVTVLEGRDHMTAIADPLLVESMRDFFISLCDCA